MDDVTIGTLPKNTRESVAVMLRTFKGHQFCDVRIMASKPEGEAVPTAKGIAIKPDALPELIRLLQDAHAAAVQAGWCAGDGP